MPDSSNTNKKGPTETVDFVIDTNPQANYRFKEPWTSLVVDNVRGFSVQLACAGGSGAIAKTAVAPLERVKVSYNRSSNSHACYSK